MSLHGLRVPWRRFVAVMTLLALANCVAYRWKPVAVTNLSFPKDKVAGRVIRLKTNPGFVEIDLTSIEFPYVTGEVDRGDGVVEFNISGARRVELLTPEAPRSKRVSATTLESIKRNPDLMKGHQVRFENARGNDIVLREVTRLEDPWITGRYVEGDAPIRVNLNQTSSVEIREVNGPKTTMKSLGLAAGIAAVVAIVVAATKSSCPFVYIERGGEWELVGEAYAGAAFRSTQRDDLLPLPDIGAASNVRIRLRNEARETQFTDRAELVVVDHPADLRALSTFDQRLVLVGKAHSPTRAYESRSRDITSLVSERDDHVWVMEPDALAKVSDSALVDEVIAEFAAPGDGVPVLEIVGGNTAWLDLVFGRFFAAMGDRLSTYLAAGNDPAAGPRIQRWRQREGVDLSVDIWSGSSWQQLAVVPTVGPAAMREVAIPIRAELKPGPIKVRVRGGLGFWRFDRLALSVQDERQAVSHRVSATKAHATRAGDRLAAIATADGQYDELSEMNESLEMSFDVPAKAERDSRTAFLSTSGYYNVHLPVQSRWQPGTLKVIRDRPGALSRFSRDLARDYARHQTAAVKNADATTR